TQVALPCVEGLTIIVVTFPTWHRPYVALYEQCLASYFTDIIQEYTNPDVVQRLTNASLVWRLPYWDWGVYTDLPSEWYSNTIQIYAPDGSTANTSNPFSAYTFHPIDSSFRRTPYANFTTTLRCPEQSGNS